MGINETASGATRMLLRHCLLHVGLSGMKGRLEVEDSCVKCSGDSLFATADATLALRRLGPGAAGTGRGSKSDTPLYHSGNRHPCGGSLGAPLPSYEVPSCVCPERPGVAATPSPTLQVLLH